MANNVVPTDGLELDLGTAEKPWRKVIARSADITGNVTASLVDVKSGSNTAVNTLQRETAYNVDDIVYTSELNARYYLLCVKDGTTASMLPSFSGATSNTQITDGTVVWRVQTVTSQEDVATISTGLTQAETRISTAETRISTAETRISTAETRISTAETRINALVPTGCVQAYAGNTTPQGWLLCDGSAVSRTDYAALYAVIGTTYGAGNGSTTFNLPNLVDKFVEGSATAGTVKSAGLPNITGGRIEINAGAEVAAHTIKTADNGNALYPDGGWARSFTVSEIVVHDDWTSAISLDASRSNSIYGNSTTVQPPALTMRYIIKY